MNDPAEDLGELVRRQAAALGQTVYVEDARSDAVLTFGVLEHWRVAFARSPLHRAPPSRCRCPIHCSSRRPSSGRWRRGCGWRRWTRRRRDVGPSGLGSLAARVGAEVVLSDRAAPGGVPCPWVELASLGARPRRVRRRGRSGNRHCVRRRRPLLLGHDGPAQGGPSAPGQAPPCGRVAWSDHHLLAEQDRGFNPLPLFHINAEVVGLLSTLLAGSCLVLDDRFHRTGFWELMGERRVTWINAVPAIISRLAELRPGERVPQAFASSARRRRRSGGDGRSVRGATGLPIVETYGMTEAASQIAAHPLSEPRRPARWGCRWGSSCASSATTTLAGAGDVPARTGGRGRDPRRLGDRLLRRGRARRSLPPAADGCARATSAVATATATCTWSPAPTTSSTAAARRCSPRDRRDPQRGSRRGLGRRDRPRTNPSWVRCPWRSSSLRGLAAGDAEETQRVVARLNERSARSLVPARRPGGATVVAALPAGATGKVRRRALREPGLAVLHTFAGT